MLSEPRAKAPSASNRMPIRTKLKPRRLKKPGSVEIQASISIGKLTTETASQRRIELRMYCRRSDQTTHVPGASPERAVARIVSGSILVSTLQSATRDGKKEPDEVCLART